MAQTCSLAIICYYNNNIVFYDEFDKSNGIINSVMNQIAIEYFE